MKEKGKRKWVEMFSVLLEWESAHANKKEYELEQNTLSLSN